MMERGEDPYVDRRHPVDRHAHAGRARTAWTATQTADDAWMATDNEGMWVFSDGTVNVLFNGGNVRSYSYQDLQGRYGLGDFDLNQPVETFGPNSPIVPCQKLDN